jgi:phosphoribosylformimino-5-aminoimidazole carboxamide ribotide isomerase
MTRFRPCIDLHSGQVKQIVGGTLSTVKSDLKTNYVSELPASHYASLYKDHDLRGGHVVMLGPGNDEAAKEALKTWPGALQVAGGITDKNAQYWIDQGAEKVSNRELCPIIDFWVHLFCDLCLRIATRVYLFQSPYSSYTV